MKMFEDVPATMLCAIALAFAYPIFHAWLLRRTEELRGRFADSGRGLLVSTNLTENDKIFVSEMMDDVFDWRFMLFATFWFPATVFRNEAANMSPQEKRFFLNEDVQDFFDLHFKCVMAASPFFTALFFVSAILTVFFILVYFGFSTISMYWGEAVKHVSPQVGSRSIVSIGKG